MRAVKQLNRQIVSFDFFRSQLQDAVVAFQDQEADYKKEIEELEEELLTAKKRESR